ncbi:MAG: YqhA family protein [Candidatus Dormibacteraeota bacterium]|nr:YqhA family protein [Candidatus Dormibacteraeota bacterium]MBO0705121.1 YqhA family protein [Candidatus Dormibacteraeota bacterium]MBO0762273.1 YqhA family protein [Candidatus Dormibacteraeota bacterium]
MGEEPLNEQPSPEPPGEGTGGPTLERLLRVGVYAAILGTIPLLLGALLAFLDAFYVLGQTVVGIFDPQHPSNVTLELIKTADIVLVGLLLFIVATGIIELFVTRRRPSWMPKWLVFENLDDLKEPVLSTLVLVIAVAYIEDVVGSSDGLVALGEGVGAAAIVAAIGLYLRLRGR